MTDAGDPTGGENNPADAAMPFWEQVVEDMAATADEYRDRGWTAHEVHPGDVSTFAGDDTDRTGIELLAPDDEFDEVAAAVDAGEDFDNAEVFRADASGVRYLVVAMEDAGTETVVLLPAYFSPGEDSAFVDQVESEGEVRIHVRPLDERRVLTFTSRDPSLFLPDDE